MNIGMKVALAVAAAAVCVAGVVGLLVHRITAADHLTTARSDLDSRLMSAAYDYAAGRRSPARLDPPDVPTAVSRAVRRGVRVTYLQDGPRPVLWAATRVSDRTVLALSRSYGPEADELAALDRTLITTGTAVTVAVSLAGLGLGLRMGRRATAAARTAERIAHGDLDARIGPRGRDEIARLAASVNAMADALGARLEAERRVTADIAHELRTPVAAMVTATGLLPPGPAADLVAGGVRKLRGLVEDVLEVARLDAHVASVETEIRQVSAMARRAVAGLDGVEVRIVTDTLVETDPRRVERILANLVANALRHGAAPVSVVVDQDGDGALVRVRDHGSGFPPALLSVMAASGPQRFRTSDGSSGTGLGLTIAAGQSRLLGTGLDFRNHPDGGAEATLRLRDPVRA
ncbi:HAMP domain-containing sensor histidine kinase [Streptomyces caniscabiei]|uniref:HAMP domain-containing sensor histidine kinase n=1 Tax=Streptomyces caniscabiei TaxID=2746961 RepID=UPI0029B9DE78|nr:HAMP domain-containing sensor histidine kinase [Streptomyces caniscabiei]MDX2604444.1 HAMP domain-containing sensor histidine kinase [Streptomyces caniscabiei]MDX2735786.1 HAMP domain-containing sensor histidine kinase [Streptomyces caniscabiei]MDX2781138.1 HAMP domain-containing sensor histidine kinase [Streptomyces caniscabiei]